MYYPACVCKTNLDTYLRIFSLFRLRTGEPMASSSASFSENKKGQMICNCPGKTVYLSATTLFVRRIHPAKASATTLSVCPSYPPCKSTEFFYSRVITSVFRYVRFVKASATTRISTVCPPRKGKCDNAACPLYPPFKARFFLFGAIRGVSSLRHVRLLREWSLLFSCDSVCAVPPISGGDQRPVRRASRAGDR